MAKLETSDFDGNSDLESLIRSMFADLERLRDALNDLSRYVHSDYLETSPELGVGNDSEKVSYVEFEYSIGFDIQDTNEEEDGVSLTGSAIPQGKWGAWALDICEEEEIDVIAASGNSSGYDDKEEAIVGISEPEDSHVRMGYVCVMKSDGAFTPNTTSLTAANVSKVFINGQTGYTKPYQVYLETHD